MTTDTVFFSQAFQKAAEILSAVQLPQNLERPLLIRDIFGRISIALNAKKSDHPSIIAEYEKRIGALGRFASPQAVLCTEDLFEPDVFFKDPSISEVTVPGTDLSVRLLDRQVTGQDWLLPPVSQESPCPRLVFFGLKGGVGRSTALAVLAYELAKLGKRVLLIDLDLESPGLSGLLLPPSRLASFGVVDWLVEDAIGQGAAVIEQIVSVSPLSDNLRQDIRVVATIGRGDVFYLDKLARAYADISEGGHLRRFSERVRRLVSSLEEREKPDVLLIDSRAGLHDLAALSIVGLATTAFLFATDSAQSWQGYHSLFHHWQSRPQVVRAVRERLKMVNALFPETDQVVRARAFLERSHSLFTETLYDEIPSGGIADSDLFNFDMENSDAPHYPLRVKWNGRFQEFDPLQIPRGLFTPDEIRAAYGEFVDAVVHLIESHEA